MWTRRLLPALAVLLLLGATGACSSADRGDSAVSSDPAAPADGTDDAADDTDDGATARESDAEAPSPDVGFAPGGDPDLQIPTATPARRSGERVIKEGTIAIEVGEGAYARAFQQVMATARTLGGEIVATSASTGDDGVTSGSVTVRVPVERYEDLLSRVGEIGELREQDVTAQDVSTEFVDLESRLRHLRAQEAFYLGLLEDAASVQDAIAVRQQLDGLQGQIEQAQGRLGYLEDRTSFSTLTVELLEPGSAPVLAGTPNTTLADYWASARSAFVTVVGWLLVGSMALVPLLPLLLIAFALWRVALRRHAAPATLTSPE